MNAYYNEIDPFCAQWLRNLIKAGLIADGEVDERSIVDVRGDDLKGFTQCHFFAGIGGWSYALRLAGWPDDRPVWTGSCPCQPFSTAGKLGGFEDERHLWPTWVHLIRERGPAIIFGEQVASAADWLRLVRGDLETLGYAVGATSIEAASAGAFHLRDRFWFVAHDQREREWRRGIQRPGESTRAAQEPASGQFAGASADIDLANTNNKGPQGRPLPAERAGERAARPDGVADTDFAKRRIGNEQPAGQFAQQQQDTRARAGGMAHSDGARSLPGTQSRIYSGEESRRPRDGEPERCSGAFDWVIGADGKARGVKSGVRLLVNGFPNRVGLLRGFGNAIDPRPAAQFIGAVMECIP